MKKTRLCPPWIEYVSKVKKLFERDKDIKVDYREQDNTLILFADSEIKYEALTHLFPESKDFGGTKLNIMIKPANDSDIDVRSYIKQLFFGNEAVANIEDVPQVMTNPLTYISFKKEVIQFWNDNLGDPHGYKSMLMEDIARDVLEYQDGILFCTDSEEEVERKQNTFRSKSYFVNHATPDEIKQWENYNGKGSYYSGKGIIDAEETENKNKKCYSYAFIASSKKNKKKKRR